MLHRILHTPLTHEFHRLGLRPGDSSGNLQTETRKRPRHHAQKLRRETSEPVENQPVRHRNPSKIIRCSRYAATNGNPTVQAYRACAATDDCSNKCLTKTDVQGQSAATCFLRKHASHIEQRGAMDALVW